MNAQKIAIVGSPCSGKSTLSRQLAEILNIPLYHLDKLFWLPGWVQRPRSEFNKLHDELTEKERWIIDGNYGRTQPNRFQKADAVVVLDFTTLLCLSRAIKRQVFHRKKIRSDITEGCVERLEYEFLKYIWRFRKTRRPDTFIRLKQNPHLDVLHFTSPQSLGLFLAKLLNEKKL